MFPLELFFLKLDEDIKDHKEKISVEDNLTKLERETLQEMRSWKEHIIRPYDKGIGFVIDSTESYKNRIKETITDPNTYTRVENVEDAIPQINARIRNLTESYETEMSPALKDWMVDDKAGFGYFYLNYKAHKPDKKLPWKNDHFGMWFPHRTNINVDRILPETLNKGDTIPLRRYFRTFAQVGNL